MINGCVENEVNVQEGELIDGRTAGPFIPCILQRHVTLL